MFPFVVRRPVDPGGRYVVYDLLETYHELGTYEFRIVLNADRYSGCDNCSISMQDSDGRDVGMTVKKWGRKMYCSFTVSPDVSDGVAVVRMLLVDDGGERFEDRLQCWVIKP